MKLVCPRCGESMGSVSKESLDVQPTLEEDLIEAHRCPA